MTLSTLQTNALAARLDQMIAANTFSNFQIAAVLSTNNLIRESVPAGETAFTYIADVAGSSITAIETGDSSSETFSADVGTVSSSASLDASGGSFIFTDDATVENNVVISNFTSDDSIVFSGALEAEYSITSGGTQGTDVIIISNIQLTISKITLLGVFQTDTTIWDQSGFETAIGFDAISFA